MAYIQDIRVDIARGTLALAQAGFGLPLIIGDGTPTSPHTVETYKVYASMDDVDNDYSSSTTEYQMAQAIFSQTPSPRLVAIYSRGTKTIEESLTDCEENNPGFWAVMIPERAIDTTVISWCQSNKKFFLGCCDHASLSSLPTTNDRAAFVIHDNPGITFPECAWAGRCLPEDPGSITWKWKTLVGPEPYEYSTTQLGDIRDANVQTITNYGGVSYVNEGKTLLGDFIDVIRGQDWVKARIEEGLYRLFLTNEKVSMDNIGIAQVEGVIRSVLQRAGNMGIIARATSENELEKSDDKEYMFQVTVPLREEVPESDRANRILSNVEFVYYLAGAIHEAEVKGKIIV